MRENTKGRQKKRRKKSKFGYYLYAIVILTLTITNITLATLLLTYVQEIHVSGTENSDKSEIIAWIEKDPLTANSLYTLCKFRFGKYKIPVYLEDVKVSLGAPWKVNVKVTEKQIVGCLFVKDSYVYFDDEGLVLRIESEYDANVPLIEGLEVKTTKLFENLKVDNEKVFSYIVSVNEELQTQSLNPDRIVWEEKSMNLYFGNVCVQLGKSNYDDKVKELPHILEKLEGESGILHMEHYTSESANISFEKSAEES